VLISGVGVVQLVVPLVVSPVGLLLLNQPRKVLELLAGVISCCGLVPRGRHLVVTLGVKAVRRPLEVETAVLRG
jgi:hypothetical protein